MSGFFISYLTVCKTQVWVVRIEYLRKLTFDVRGDPFNSVLRTALPRRSMKTNLFWMTAA